MKVLFINLLISIAAVFVGGCQSYGGMSPEQIAAATKDKSASCIYGKSIFAWGTVEATVIGYDQRTISNGGINVGDKCSSLSVVDTKPAPKDTTPVVPTPLVPKSTTPAT